MNSNVALLADEGTLAARASTEPVAFAALYDHYFPRVYTYIRYRVGDLSAADDLTALVFERALTKIASYDPDGAPFAVWLFAIARNAVSDHLRAQRRRRWLSLDALRHAASAAPQPDELVIDGERQAALLAALARLSDRDRDLLALKFAMHLTNRRIAAISGLSESNVGVIIHRALGRLRGVLEDLDESDS